MQQHSSPVYQQLLGLFDFTDSLLDRIKDVMADEHDTREYFLTFVRIEAMFDGYARGLVYASAKEEGKSDDEASALSKEANERMDKLRLTIRRLVQANDYDDLLKEAGTKMYEDWHKLPADHPNADPSWSEPV